MKLFVTVIPCDEADEIYKTILFAGWHDKAGRLFDHAIWCEREDWHHALFTEHWSWMKKERRRRGERHTT